MLMFSIALFNGFNFLQRAYFCVRNGNYEDMFKFIVSTDIMAHIYLTKHIT